LKDYHSRTINGILPVASGADIANTLKYFSQTLLGYVCICTSHAFFKFLVTVIAYNSFCADYLYINIPRPDSVELAASCEQIS